MTKEFQHHGLLGRLIDGSGHNRVDDPIFLDAVRTDLLERFPRWTWKALRYHGLQGSGEVAQAAAPKRHASQSGDIEGADAPSIGRSSASSWGWTSTWLR